LWTPLGCSAGSLSRRRAPAGRGILPLTLAGGALVCRQGSLQTGRYPRRVSSVAGSLLLVQSTLPVQQVVLTVVGETFARPSSLVALVSDLVPVVGLPVAFGGDEVPSFS
jgi:hypothetical protein